MEGVLVGVGAAMGMAMEPAETVRRVVMYFVVGAAGVGMRRWMRLRIRKRKKPGLSWAKQRRSTGCIAGPGNSGYRWVRR